MTVVADYRTQRIAGRQVLHKDVGLCIIDLSNINVRDEDDYDGIRRLENFGWDNMRRNTPIFLQGGAVDVTSIGFVFRAIRNPRNYPVYILLLVESLGALKKTIRTLTEIVGRDAYIAQLDIQAAKTMEIDAYTRTGSPLRTLFDGGKLGGVLFYDDPENTHYFERKKATEDSPLIPYETRLRMVLEDVEAQRRRRGVAVTGMPGGVAPPPRSTPAVVSYTGRLKERRKMVQERLRKIGRKRSGNVPRDQTVGQSIHYQQTPTKEMPEWLYDPATKGIVQAWKNWYDEILQKASFGDWGSEREGFILDEMGKKAEEGGKDANLIKLMTSYEELFSEYEAFLESLKLSEISRDPPSPGGEGVVPPGDPVEGLKRTIEELRSALDVREGEIIRLKSDIYTQKQELANKTDVNTKSMAEIERLRSSNDGLTDKLFQRDKEIETLTDNMKAVALEYRNIVKKEKKLMREKVEELAELKPKLSEHENTLKRKEDTIIFLRSSNDTQKREISSLRSNNGNLRNEIEVIKAEVSKSTDKLNVKESVIKELNAKLSTMKSSLAKNKKMIDISTETINIRDSTIENLLAKNERITKEIKRTTGEVKTLTSKIEDNVVTEREFAEKLAGLENDLSKRKNTIRNNLIEINDLREFNNTLTSKMESLQKENDTLGDEIKHLESKIPVSTGFINEKDREISELKTKITTLESSFEVNIGNINDARRTIESRNITIKSLGSENGRMTTEIERMRSKVEFLTNEVKTMKTDTVDARKKHVGEMRKLHEQLEGTENATKKRLSETEEKHKSIIRDLKEAHEKRLDEEVAIGVREVYQEFKTEFEAEKLVLEEEISQLTTINDNMTMRVSENNRMVQNIVRQLERTKEAHSSTKESLSKVREELAEAIQNGETLLLQLGEREAGYNLEKETYEKIIEGLNKSNDDKAREMVEMKIAHEQLLKNRGRIITELRVGDFDVMRRNLEKNATVIARLRRTLSNVKNSLREMHIKNRTLISRLRETDIRNREQMTIIMTLRSLNSGIESENFRLVDIIESKDTQMKELRNKTSGDIATLNESLRKTGEKNKRLHENLSTTYSQLTQAQKSLAGAQPEYTAYMENIQKENVSLSEDLERTKTLLRVSVSGHENAMRRIKSLRENEKTLIRNHEDSIRVLNETLRTVKGNFIESNAANKDLSRRLTSEREKLTQEKDALSKKVEAAEGKNTKLLDELGKFRMSNAELKQWNEDRDEEFKNFKVVYDATIEKNTQIPILEEKLKTANSTITSLKFEKKRLEDRNSTLKITNDRSVEVKGRLGRTIEILKREKVGLVKRNSTLKTTNDKFMEVEKRLNIHIASLATKIDEANGKIRALTRQRDTLLESKNILKGDLEKSKGDSKGWKTKLDGLLVIYQLQIESHKKDIDENKTNNESLLRKLNDLLHKHEFLGSGDLTYDIVKGLDILDRHLGIRSKLLTNTAKRVQTLRAKNVILFKKLGDTQNKLGESNMKIEDLRRQVFFNEVEMDRMQRGIRRDVTKLKKIIPGEQPSKLRRITGRKRGRGIPDLPYGGPEEGFSLRKIPQETGMSKPKSSHSTQDISSIKGPTIRDIFREIRVLINKYT